jgi:hypothetical protein
MCQIYQWSSWKMPKAFIWNTEKSTSFSSGCRDPLRWPRDPLYPQKLALTSPTCVSRSVGIVRLRIKGRRVYVCHKVSSFPKRCRLQMRAELGLLVSSRRSWFSSHRSWDENWFSKQITIPLAFSFGWYVIPKCPWTAVGAFSPPIFVSDFAINHRAWGVTS